MYRITNTNYSNSGSKWTGVSLYRNGELIVRVKTTSGFGSMNYIRRYKKSKYRKEFIEKCRENLVPEIVISMFLRGYDYIPNGLVE